jgi:hypothetical protein
MRWKMTRLEDISMEVPKVRKLYIQPWVAAQLSDVWSGMKKQIENSIVRKGKQGRARISPLEPASSHNQT